MGKYSKDGSFYGKISETGILPVIPFESLGTVDKNRRKCVIFVYRLVQIQGARPRK